ncbi:MAG: adenylate/guanylate cyclase domain-containing protein [Bacteroidota bacterium]
MRPFLLHFCLSLFVLGIVPTSILAQSQPPQEPQVERPRNRRPAPPRMKRMRDWAKAQREKVIAAMDSMSAEKPMLRKELDSTTKQIEKLSNEQAKAELLLARKQILLDALTMERDSLDKARFQDSLSLVMQGMKLQENELKLQEQQLLIEKRNGQAKFLLSVSISGILLLCLLAYLFFKSRRFNKQLNAQKQAIEAAQQQSEKLLLNILPSSIAKELKQKGKAAAQQYSTASVLFSDFKGFSKIASTLPPDQLVADLDYCFKAFDRIITKYQLEKIKTIGDAYMCAGGLPKTDASHPYRMIQAALEMQVFLANWKEERLAQQRPCFEARIGIHTGPLVAGVVGEKKFAYDIWGDTVNIAARIESGGEAGRINISEATYQLVHDQFQCTYRGKIPAKNIGEIDMYFVES